MRVATVTTLLCVSLGLSTLSAQQPLRIDPGTRVRLTAPSCGARELPATLEAVRGDTLVATARSRWHCPLAAVTRLELYRGRRSHPWRGAGIGFLVGAGAGFLGYYAVVNSCYEGAEVSGCALVFGGAGGGLAGALIGAVVGGMIKTDRWEAVPIRDVSVAPIGTRNGFGLRASVRF